MRTTATWQTFITTSAGRGAMSCQIVPATTSGWLFFTTVPRSRCSKRSVRWRSHPKTMQTSVSRGSRKRSEGLDRNPYLATFQAGKFTLLLATVHLFFGDDKQQNDIDRRSLETFAVARWAEREATSKTGYTRNLLVLGDFNMPKADPADPIYKALTKKGLQVPAHSSQVGSTITPVCRSVGTDDSALHRVKRNKARQLTTPPRLTA